MEPVGKMCCGCARVVMEHHHRDRGRNKQETGRLTRNGGRPSSEAKVTRVNISLTHGKGRGGEGEPEQQRL